MESLLSPDGIEARIFVLRGQKVLIDLDLAELYGVTVKRLREQIRRNPQRFPADFMFTLDISEKNALAANCGEFRNLKNSRTLPYAFTEHGALMVASVLNSPAAVQIGLEIVRVFVRLRRVLASNRELADKLASLETKYDRQFETVFEALDFLMTPEEEKPKRKMGFVKEE
jgi:hypothetical protein